MRTRRPYAQDFWGFASQKAVFRLLGKEAARRPWASSSSVCLKGAKITIEPVSWHFASTTGVIRRGPLPCLPRLVPAPWPRCLVPSVRVGQDAEIVVLGQRCEFSKVNSTDVSGTGEAFETLAAVVVLEEEREAGVGFGPDAVAVGADDLTPLPGTAPFRPPLVEPAAGRVRAEPNRQ